MKEGGREGGKEGGSDGGRRWNLWRGDGAGERRRGRGGIKVPQSVVQESPINGPGTPVRREDATTIDKANAHFLFVCLRRAVLQSAPPLHGNYSFININDKF